MKKVVLALIGIAALAMSVPGNAQAFHGRQRVVVRQQVVRQQVVVQKVVAQPVVAQAVYAQPLVVAQPVVAGYSQAVVAPQVNGCSSFFVK